MTDSQCCTYVVACAAPPVLRVGELVAALQGQWRQVCVLLTPTAASWLNPDSLEERVGCPVRVHSGMPGENGSLPRADDIIVAPLTFNTLNKWAAGFSDTLALGVLCEALGFGVPIVAAPCVKATLRKHPAYDRSVRLLSAHGVVFLEPDEITYRASDGLATFRWDHLLSAVRT